MTGSAAEHAGAIRKKAERVAALTGGTWEDQVSKAIEVARRTAFSILDVLNAVENRAVSGIKDPWKFH